jgi:hypothetical protein
MCVITCPRPSGHQIMLSPFHLVNRCLDNTIYIIFICTLARRYPPKCLPSLVRPLALDQSPYTSVLRCSYFISTNSLDLHHFLRLHASVFNTCASQKKKGTCCTTPTHIMVSLSTILNQSSVASRQSLIIMFAGG